MDTNIGCSGYKSTCNQ